MTEGWPRRIARFPLTRVVVALLIYGSGFAVTPWLLQSMRAGYAQWVVAKAVAAVFALIALVVTVKFMERRPLEELMGPPKSAIAELAIGFALAAGIVSVCIGIFAAFGWYRIESAAIGPPFATMALLFFFVAIDEEIAFRGLLFRTLEDGLGSWAALVLSGLFFGFAHAGNQNSTIFTNSAIAIEAGLLLGAAYMVTRRLWLVFGLHWAWNLFEGPVWGLPVSGIQLPSLIDATELGPDAWTGGAFGPEGGGVMVILCSLVTVAMLYRARRGGMVRGPMWSRPRAGAERSAEAADGVSSAVK